MPPYPREYVFAPEASLSALGVVAPRRRGRNGDVGIGKSIDTGCGRSRSTAWCTTRTDGPGPGGRPADIEVRPVAVG